MLRNKISSISCAPPKLPQNFMSDMISSRSSEIFPMHVIGGGSIGLLYASAIQDAYCKKFNGLHSIKTPVILLMRSHHKVHLKRYENDLANSKSSQLLFAPVSVYKLSNNNDGSSNNRIFLDRKCSVPVELIPIANKETNSPISCLLLCTKANDAIPALGSISDRWNVDNDDCQLNSKVHTKIIIMSNGALSIRDSIKKNFPDNRIEIILATTTHGVSRNNTDDDKYSIIHAGEGSTYCTDKQFIQVCESLGRESKLLSELDMNVMLWKKLAVNCVINPLTAIHGVKNGELIGLQHMGQDITVTIMNVLDEVSRIATKEIESLYSETITKEFSSSSQYDDWLQTAKLKLSSLSLRHFVNEVMSVTASNVSSMLHDVRAKRVTEIQYLNGYVSALGERYGIYCHYNKSLCSCVEKLTESLTISKDKVS